MSIGRCRQKIPPDSPSLRVRTPSKSHAEYDSISAKWIFMNYRTILNIINVNETPKKIPDIREMTIFWKHAKMKRDVLWENGLQIHFNIQKEKEFCKVSKLPILQRLSKLYKYDS